MRQMQALIMQELHVEPGIEPEAEIERRIEFLVDYVLRLQAKGFVLGISGGQDSTLAGRLAQLAVERATARSGRDLMFVAVRLPYGVQRDEADALLAIEFIKPTQALAVDIKPAVDASVEAFNKALGRPMSDYIKGNAKARERMKVQYDVAGQLGLLVVGTNNAAEAATGFYTKYGDGACDVEPLAGLTKRQVGEMLVVLKAPARLCDKVPTADLLDEKPGRTDEEELGVDYDEIDDYLEGRLIDPTAAARIEQLYMISRHKRHLPVTPVDSWWKE